MRPALLVALLAGFSCPSGALACAACYGQTDSPLAEGMNWGIFSLLAVVLVIWAGIGAVAVHFARRSARMAREQTAQVFSESADRA